MSNGNPDYGPLAEYIRLGLGSRDQHTALAALSLVPEISAEEPQWAVILESALVNLLYPVRLGAMVRAAAEIAPWTSLAARSAPVTSLLRITFANLQRYIRDDRIPSDARRLVFDGYFRGMQAGMTEGRPLSAAFASGLTHDEEFARECARALRWGAWDPACSEALRRTFENASLARLGYVIEVMDLALAEEPHERRIEWAKRIISRAIEGRYATRVHPMMHRLLPETGDGSDARGPIFCYRLLLSHQDIELALLGASLFASFLRSVPEGPILRAVLTDWRRHRDRVEWTTVFRRLESTGASEHTGDIAYLASLPW